MARRAGRCFEPQALGQITERCAVDDARGRMPPPGWPTTAAVWLAARRSGLCRGHRRSQSVARRSPTWTVAFERDREESAVESVGRASSATVFIDRGAETQFAAAIDVGSATGADLFFAKGIGAVTSRRLRQAIARVPVAREPSRDFAECRSGEREPRDRAPPSTCTSRSSTHRRSSRRGSIRLARVEMPSLNLTDAEIDVLVTLPPLAATAIAVSGERTDGTAAPVLPWRFRPVPVASSAMSDRTLVLLKPDTVSAASSARSLGRFEAQELTIVAMDLRTLDADTLAATTRSTSARVSTTTSSRS